MTSGREEVFQANFAALELCQKSLSDYLEVKKKKFPRFYFISGNDLVDILSKGRYPPAVQEHFSKFTDCTGGIEDWLNELIDHQVNMFRDKTKESIDGFVEFP